MVKFLFFHLKSYYFLINVFVLSNKFLSRRFCEITNSLHIRIADAINMLNKYIAISFVMINFNRNFKQPYYRKIKEFILVFTFWIGNKEFCNIKYNN